MNNFWINKKVLITGHTGFVGSWLTLALNNFGTNVYGISLNIPTIPSHFEYFNNESVVKSFFVDIRDRKKLEECINNINPDIIFHLAAQSLVIDSYHYPEETFSTNIMGTVNLLEIFRANSSTNLFINITSDKCYENNNIKKFFKETDRLGGHDPYSCSKSCSELITNSYNKSFLKNSTKKLLSVRAGNIIGGGDWSQNRLIPDLIRAAIDKKKLVIRNPSSIRPWQHVFDAINGYLLLAYKASQSNNNLTGAWNFGPNNENIFDVQTLIEEAMKYIKCEIIYANPNENLEESKILMLDSSKAKKNIGWNPRLDKNNSIKKTMEWYIEYLSVKGNKESMYKFSNNQILAFFGNE